MSKLKSENSNCIVEKPSYYHFNQMIKANITSNGTCQYHIPVVMMQEKREHHFYDILSENTHPELIMRRHR